MWSITKVNNGFIVENKTKDDPEIIKGIFVAKTLPEFLVLIIWLSEGYGSGLPFNEFKETYTLTVQGQQIDLETAKKKDKKT